MNQNKQNSNVQCWDFIELTFNGPKAGNPFIDTSFSAEFKYKNKVIYADGFYDGDGIYKVRFMPDKVGIWTYTTNSNAPELDSITGHFECTEPLNKNHGPVRIRNKFHFSYEDGTPYFPFGTTCYVWNHQGDELEKQTLETLKNSPFNKIRMCVFPKHYEFNHNEPAYYPFEGSLENGWNFEKFNPEFFRHLERLIYALRELQIEADLILFHPYDRWGYSKMSTETDDFYLKYIVARLSAFRNIWWSFANEYDLMRTKTTLDWDRFFNLVQERDPYQHLRSIHNCVGFYDHGKPWVTHCSVQHSDLSKTTEWRNLYKKPVVIDECCYEGNISSTWGNITAEEMVNRFWEGFARGGYVGHGETYFTDNEILWWAKGGVLHGKSPARIAFLRKIIEEGPKEGIDTANIGFDNKTVSGKGTEYFLAYYGNSQAVFKDLVLPEGKKYSIEIIDAFEMTIKPIEGIFEGKCRVFIPSKPYIALRIKQINS